MKKTISSPDAPKATGPFSQAILYNAKYVIELSGQLGINPETGKLADGITEQTKQSMKNVFSVLSEAGWDSSNIVKCRIFLADMADYSAVNEIYGAYFHENPPARLALAVKQLPLNALIEIECVAAGDRII